MQDLIDGLQHRYDEISDFMMHTREEREKMISRTTELEVALDGADRDQRRLTQAINILRGENTPISSDAARLATVPGPSTPPYRPSL